MRIRGIIALATIALVSSTSAVSALNSSIRGAASVQDAARRASAPVTFTPETPATDPIEAEIIRLVNAERARHGLPAFARDARITAAAGAHAADMASRRQLDHTGGDGSSVGDRLRRAGFTARAWGETIGAGYRTPAAVVQGWFDSPPHRAILLGDYSLIGAAVATASDGVQYWALDVAHPA